MMAGTDADGGILPQPATARIQASAQLRQLRRLQDDLGVPATLRQAAGHRREVLTQLAAREATDVERGEVGVGDAHGLEAGGQGVEGGSEAGQHRAQVLRLEAFTSALRSETSSGERRLNSSRATPINCCR